MFHLRKKCLPAKRQEDTQNITISAPRQDLLASQPAVFGNSSILAGAHENVKYYFEEFSLIYLDFQFFYTLSKLFDAAVVVADLNFQIRHDIAQGYREEEGGCGSGDHTHHDGDLMREAEHKAVVKQNQSGQEGANDVYGNQNNAKYRKLAGGRIHK